MRFIISLGAIVLCQHFSSKAFCQVTQQHVNIDSVQKVHIDSTLRIMMTDSLELSTTIITQIFALRDSGASQTQRIIEDHSLSFGQKNAAIQALRIETSEAIKNAMGSGSYHKYMEIILDKRLDD